MLQSCERLSGAATGFRGFCVEGLEANVARIETLLDQSLMLVTDLAPTHPWSLKEAALVLAEIAP